MPDKVLFEDRLLATATTKTPNSSSPLVTCLEECRVGYDPRWLKADITSEFPLIDSLRRYTSRKYVFFTLVVEPEGIHVGDGDENLAFIELIHTL